MTETYLGAEQLLIGLWVEQRIAARAATLDVISAGLSTRVYPDMAPPTAGYPFIVHQVQTPVRDIRGVGVVRVMVDTLYLVKAVAQTDSFTPLLGVAKEIDLAMTSPDVTTVSDGLVLVSVREEQFSLVTVEAGKQFRHLGGVYRIQAQA